MTLGDLSVTRAAASRRRGLLRWLAAPLKPFFVVTFPDRVRPEVVGGRYGLPLLSVVMCACLAAFAVGTRLDVGFDVRAENAGAPAATATTKNAGSAKTAKPQEIKTDREIDEEIEKRLAVDRVKLGMSAVFATPLRVLALGLALLLLARFIGGKPTMPRVLTVAALAAVPGAVRSLVTALVAWQRPRVFPDELGSLVRFPQVIPDGHPVLARLFAGVDVFTWWSVIIVAVGLCTAADIKPRKSIIAVAITFVLYLLVTGLIMGGPPPGAGR